MLSAGNDEKPEDEGFESVDLSDSDSEYERILHPNEERPDKTEHHHAGFLKYMNRFDELIMKPIFIYKYEKSMQKKSKEFFNLFMKQGDEIEHDFVEDGMSKKAMRE